MKDTHVGKRDRESEYNSLTHTEERIGLLFTYVVINVCEAQITLLTKDNHSRCPQRITTIAQSVREK